jgi:hypothetical protein
VSEPDYFLPFTPNGRTTELTAIRVKQKLGLGAYAGVDPIRVLPRVPGRILEETTIACFPDHVRQALFSDEVSAIGYGMSPVTGEWLIFVNPTQAPTRQKVSLMEEIVHISLGHPKTELSLAPDGRIKWKRPYNKAVEDEAFCVGAACVIPYKALFFAIKREHLNVADLAAKYGVSEECVRYRIKRAGLARVYGSLAA